MNKLYDYIRKYAAAAVVVVFAMIWSMSLFYWDSESARERLPLYGVQPVNDGLAALIRELHEQDRPVPDASQLPTQPTNPVTLTPSTTTEEPLPSAGGLPSGQAGDAGLATERIDLNHATSDQLQQLPGIGPAKARAIIDYRFKHGPFTATVEIMRVNGIGEKTYENLRERIMVADERLADELADEQLADERQ